MSGTRALHCDEWANGPAVVLELSDEDAKRWQEQREREPRTAGIGEWCEVTDQSSGEAYLVASAPCGLGCHCAAVASKVSEA